MRTYVGSMTLRFSAMTVRGRLMPVYKSEESNIKMCVPGKGVPVYQKYLDDEGNLYDRNELGRAVVDEDGVMTEINADALEAAKISGLPSNILTMTAHEPESIEQYLQPDSTKAYLFEPVIKEGKKIKDDPENDHYHDLLNVMVRDSGLVFVGYANIHGSEGVYRVGMYQGHLTVQRQVFPEKLNQFEVIHPAVSAGEREKLLAIARGSVREFNPEEYKSKVRDAIEAVKSADFDPSSTVIAEPRAIDFSAALDQMLAEV